MYPTMTMLVGGLGALVLLQVASMLITAHRRSSRARELGCEPPPLVPNDSFLGIATLRGMLDADSKMMFAEFLFGRYRRMTETLGRPAATIQYNTLGATMIQTYDPKNVQALLATQFNDFGLGANRNGNMGAMLGSGIFTQDGQAWEHSRAMLRPNFVRDQVADIPLIEKHVQHLMLALPASSDTKGWTQNMNLQTLFFRLTLDASTEFLFGDSVNSQLAELPNKSRANQVNKIKGDEKEFAFAFDNGQKHLAKRFRLADFWWTHNPKDFKESSKVANDFVDNFVKIALDKKSKENAAEEGQKTRYIFADSLAQQTQNPVEIRAQLLNILLAGRDTTASLLSYVFHYLVRDQEIFNKLRSTIVKDFGTYESPENFSFASLKGCTYLQWCIDEALRLSPVVPSNARTAFKDTTIPRGGGVNGDKPVFVKKGQTVEYSVYVMQRRTDLWGEDAGLFRPERWQGKRPGWEYLPFNGGPRICIGQQFAIIEASYVIVRLLQRFDKLEGAGDELATPLTNNLTLTAAPGKGPIVRLREAEH